MTTKERNALTMELLMQSIRDHRFISFEGHTLFAKHKENGMTYQVEQHIPTLKRFGEFSCPLEAILDYRQKLAAEREAAISPREKRLEKALKTIANHEPLTGDCRWSRETADKALKEE